MSNKIDYYLNEIGSRFSGMNASQAIVAEKLGVLKVKEADATLVPVINAAIAALTRDQTLTSEAGAATQEFADYLHAGTFTEGSGPGPVDPPFSYPEPSQVVVTPYAWGASYRGNAGMTVINAFQFVAQKTGNIAIGVTTYGSPPTTFQSSISENPGELGGASYSEGNETSSPFDVVEGKTYYVNFRAWSQIIGPTATYPVQGVAVEGRWL